MSEVDQMEHENLFKMIREFTAKMVEYCEKIDQRKLDTSEGITPLSVVLKPKGKTVVIDQWIAIVPHSGNHKIRLTDEITAKMGYYGEHGDAVHIHREYDLDEFGKVLAVRDLKKADNTESPELCVQCSSSDIVTARDMYGTRHCCKCGHSWLPIKVEVKA